MYGSWGTTGVQRGDDWAKTSRYTNNVTGNTTRVTRTSDGDVYAGRDGNVYRKEGDSYQKYGDGGWNNVDRPTPEQRQQAQDRAAQAGTQARDRATASGMDSATRQQVTRDSAARAEGAQRTRDSGQVRSGASHAVRQLPRERRAGRRRAAGGGAERSRSAPTQSH